jgi:hypothetical protein
MGAQCTCRREHVGVGSHDKACPRYDHLLWKVISPYRPGSWWPEHDLIEAAMPLDCVFRVREMYRMDSGARPEYLGHTFSKIRRVDCYTYEVNGSYIHVESVHL